MLEIVGPIVLTICAFSLGVYQSLKFGTYTKPHNKNLGISIIVCLPYLSSFFLLTSSENKYFFLFPLAVYSYPIIATDIVSKRIPNSLNLQLAVFQTLGIIVFSNDSTFLDLIIIICLGLLVSTLYFLINLFSGGKIGIGDAKLAYSLAIVLAVNEWRSILIGTVISFLFAAAFGIVLLILRRVTLRDKLAFAPFMILGTWTTLLIQLKFPY